MKMNEIESESEFQQLLFTEAKNHGITLDGKVLKNLEIYKNMLVEWNNKINLTAITDDRDIIVKHFVDCLMCTKYIDVNSNVIDIGTGAGFPGMVIAIYFNDKLKITLLDSLNKRLIFLAELVSNLGFNNVELVHGRAEEIAHKSEYRQKFDIAISRAVAPLNILLEYAVCFIKINGRCLFMKSNKVDEELKLSNNAIKLLKCKFANKYDYELNLNEEIYIRNILDIIKIDETPIKYPRSYSNIKNKPL